ncbi:hypothetical protein FLM44_09635 [Pseudoalteromonas luteoviolacea]|nr:hypothetical protein FLM44_09635 [Pseudoalteromonas luteoviolacea]
MHVKQYQTKLEPDNRIAFMYNSHYLDSKSVHKFGGSSLSSATSYLHVASIIKDHCRIGDWVVVSAAGKTTNKLLSIMHSSSTSPKYALEMLESLRDYQTSLINAAPEEMHALLLAQLSADFDTLSKMVWANKAECKSESEWCCFGEIWSARLLATVLLSSFHHTVMVDARKILIVKNDEVDFQMSRNNLRQHLSKTTEALSIMTGFIAADNNGCTVTLGRNGSDYSASLITNLLNARALYFWTDVEGVFSADPRIVKSARLIPRISRSQIQILAQSGNTILHARTLLPLQSNNCNIVIKSSLKPLKQGSVVTVKAQPHVSFLSKTNEVCLITEERSTLLSQEHILYELPEEQGGGCLVSLESVRRYPKLENQYILVDMLVFYSNCKVDKTLTFSLEQLGINFKKYNLHSTGTLSLIVLHDSISNDEFSKLHEFAIHAETQSEAFNEELMGEN